MKARRKLKAISAGIEKVHKQVVRDFREIELMEHERLMTAFSMLDGEFIMLDSSAPQNGPGRPAGKGKLESRCFVYGLLMAVRRAGGELRFDRVYKGVLLAALEVLANYLPASVKDGLSLRLLHDVCRNPSHTVDMEIPYFMDSFLMTGVHPESETRKIRDSSP